MLMSFRRLLYAVFFTGISISAAAVLIGVFAFVVAYPQLPSVAALTDYKPKLPLRIYSREGVLIGEFGREHREFLPIENVPDHLKNAIIAAEDERFMEHHGIDFLGIGRAALANFAARGARQGASTITMQVARNFFLTSEKTLTRKFNEALLAIKIERNLTKNEILELYVNQIYLGQRAFGFAAASKIYFGKPLAQASLAELSMMAGLPKAPSRYNPAVNFKRAQQRQFYVLGRMHKLGFISDSALDAAKAEKIKLSSIRSNPSRHAEYFVEMVRQALIDQYGEATYTKGLNVYTTLSLKNQEAAFRAVKTGLENHDQRQGFRGAVTHFNLSRQSEEDIEELLNEFDAIDNLVPSVITKITDASIQIYAKGNGFVTLQSEDFQYGASNALSPSDQHDPLTRGDLIYVRQLNSKKWSLSQLPIAEGALIAIDSDTGAIQALVGGYNFYKNKFNHVTQALRQPGSSFKPFIYSAALERGFTPATIIDDSPIEIDESQTGYELWEPQNYDGEFSGPISLRYALAKSKNLVAIRILQAIEPTYARDFITRFGFNKKNHPPYLTMALGAGSTTPLSLARGYAVFANGGHLVNPFFISRVEDIEGNLIFKASPQRSKITSNTVIDARNAFTMNSLLRDVVNQGTGKRAKSLGRNDLAGKTGTTNDNVDAWFAGFQRHTVAITWVGKDQPGPLGEKETGAKAALPIWIDYMRVALRGIPEEDLPDPPEGIRVLKIDPDTGTPNQRGITTEYFYEENVPTERPGYLF